MLYKIYTAVVSKAALAEDLGVSKYRLKAGSGVEEEAAERPGDSSCHLWSAFSVLALKLYCILRPLLDYFL